MITSAKKSKSLLNALLELNFKILCYLIFLITPIYIYTIAMVGHSHGGNGLDFLFMFIHSIIINLLINFYFFRRPKNKLISGIVRMALFLGLLPIIAMIVGLFYYWFTKPTLFTHDIVAIIVIFTLLVSIVLGLIGVVKGLNKTG